MKKIPTPKQALLYSRLRKMGYSVKVSDKLMKKSVFAKKVLALGKIDYRRK